MDANARKLIMETYKTRAHKAHMRGDVAAQVRASTDWRSLATDAEARRAPRWLWWRSRPRDERRWGRFPGMALTLHLSGTSAVSVAVADYAEASHVAMEALLSGGAAGPLHGQVHVGSNLVARVLHDGKVVSAVRDVWRRALLYTPVDEALVA